MNYEIINLRKKELGLNNAQIAAQSGITLSTIDKITSGANQNPKLDTLFAIADVLGLTLDDFDDRGKIKDDMYRKYESLDDHGKLLVDTVLDLEYERCTGTAKDSQ
jgi:transcriptional regulator with XRE-family HTH domain